MKKKILTLLFSLILCLCIVTPAFAAQTDGFASEYAVSYTHLEKRKTDGEFFTEKDCPSCGANFMPDENNCCSFCGYGLQVNNAKWIDVYKRQSL